MCSNVLRCLSTTAQETVPFGSGALLVGTTMEELAQRLQQLETQVGKQRAVIEHQQDQLMHQQRTIDADRAARTPVTPNCPRIQKKSGARPSKSSSSEANTVELNPMTAAEVEQAALAREHAAFRTPGPVAGATLDGDGEPAVRIKVPTGPATPSAEERAPHEASRHVPYRSWCQWCIAARAADKPHLRGQQPDTDEAVPRIEFDFADLGREEDQVLPIPSLNTVDVGSESLSATLCPTQAFSEYLVETILAFVEALGHNVVMLHSDQEPVLVQLLKAVQSRRVKRTGETWPESQPSESG